MTRPLNPSWTVLPFAPDTNYPAGSLPWSGTPTKVPWSGAPGPGFTPKTAVPAQAVNYYNNHFSDRLSLSKNAIGGVLDFAGQLQALNFPFRTVSGIVGLCDVAYYEPVKRVWYFAGQTNERDQVTNGQDFSSGTSNIVGLTAGEFASWIEGDTSGNIVLASNSRYVFQRPVATGVWTKVDVVGAVISAEPAAVVYVPTLGKWVWASDDGVQIRTFYSTTRLAWTAGGNIAAGVSQSLHNLACNKTTGRVVHACLDGTIVRVSTSDDAATTWTVRASLGVLSSPTAVNLIRDDANDKFYIFVSKTSPAASEVWQSTDQGVTWNKISSLTTAGFGRPAVLGAMMVVPMFGPVGNEIAFSLDGGVTWLPTGVLLSGSLRGIYAGNGQLLVAQSTELLLGLRAGKPAFSALT